MTPSCCVKSLRSLSARRPLHPTSLFHNNPHPHRPSQDGLAYAYECVNPTTAENVQHVFQEIMHFFASPSPV